MLCPAAKAETVLMPNGQALDSLFTIVSNKKTITCAGPIKGSYQSGSSISINNTKIFTPLSDDMAALKSKLKSAKVASAKSKIQAKIAKLKVRIKSENKICSAGPGDTTPPPSSPVVVPTIKPTATPTPNTDGNYDSQGNVTAAGKTAFGIPSNLSASRETGRSIYNASCSGCHLEKTGRSFSFYKTAIQGSPMYIFDKTDQDLANITAYLRRFELN